MKQITETPQNIIYPRGILKMARLYFTNLEGTIGEIDFDINTPVTVELDGQRKDIKLSVGKTRTVVDINDMTQDELKKEIRNAKSVAWKNRKAFEAAENEEAAEAAMSKLSAAEARVEAATKLMAEKFPNAVSTKKASKIQQLEAILETIKSSNISDEEKAAAVANVEALIAAAMPKKKAPKAE